VTRPASPTVAGSTTTFGFVTADPTNANFGRIVGKNDARRDVQLSLRYQF